MRKFLAISFCSALLLCSLAAIAQTYNDGPMELQIRVTEVRVDYHPDLTTSDDFNLSGSIGGVINGLFPLPNLATDEISCKVWARASQDVTALGWQGGTTYTADLPMAIGGPESFVISNPVPIFSTVYNAATVPQFFDLKVQAWEDDKAGDFDQLPASVAGILTNDCQTADGFLRDVYEGTNSCCIKIFGACVYSEKDDLECNADPFQVNLDYRLGPPCQWYSHGFVAGNCPQNNYYQIKVESYYRFTIGLNCASPIDLGTLAVGSGNVLSHFNSNECYSNTLVGSQPGNDVYYKFTVNNPIGIDINLCNSSTLFDTYVYLLDGNCQIIDENDNGNGPGCGNRSLISKSLCAPGDYYVVVDAKTALSLGTFRLFIAENTSFTFAATIAKTNPKCNGSSDGEAEVNVTGGEVPLTYLWSNGDTDTLATGLAANTYTVTVTDNGGCGLTATTTLINPAAMTVTTSSTDLTCSGANDGTVTANVTGGTGPFFYAWNSSPAQNAQTAVNLPAGSYNVIVTDINGCINGIAPAAVVTANNPIVVAETITHISCFGVDDGSVALNVSGGIPPYTYSWSTGATTPTVTALSPGSVTVTVFDNTNGGGQCFEIETYLINEPTLLVSAVNETRDVSCNGGSDGAVNLGVSGGTLPYTYSWSGGAISEDLLNASGGAFSVTVIDGNGCQTVTAGTLNEPSPVTSSIAPTDAGCDGTDSGAADLTVSGGAGGYTFFWSNFSTGEDVSNLPAGKYIVFITDANGCPHVDSLTISGFGELRIQSTTSSPCADKNDGKVMVNVLEGAAPFTYVWSDASTDAELANVGEGSYSVTVTDANGCTESVTFDLEPKLNCSGGILDVAIPNIFSPNGDGNNDNFDVWAAEDVSKIEVKIYDRWGAKIYENSNQTPNIQGQGWNGKNRGEDAQLGSYVYVMEIEYSTPTTTDRPTQKTGTVTVVR
ncbi:MAG: gliding motility-associated C-terminal domain-containing protein [Chitinophagales bacterium]|nr:gliding motility-associated C-terminal domain-containing protein [Chitinophagales bacterium]